MPKAGNNPLKAIPKKDRKKEAPKEGDKKEAPKQKGIKKEAPKQEAKKEAPKQEAKKEAPKEGDKKEAPKQEAKKEAPKQEAKKEAPKQEAKKEATKKEEAKGEKIIMLQVKIFTLYPDIFPGYLSKGIFGKALEKKLWNLKIVNIRDYADDKHKTVDDTVIGGGSGMLLKPDVLANSIDKNIKKGEKIFICHPKVKN